MQEYFSRQFFDGDLLRKNVCFSVADGKIIAVKESEKPGQATEIDGLVVPGFVDIQVNGGGGVQFNSEPTAECLVKMANAHLQTGSGSIMPTLITDDLAVMRQGADAIAEARKILPSAIPGVHFEGPHLSAAKKGMHSASHIRPLSDEELAIFARNDLGQVLVTVAPESVTTDDIRKLTDLGIIVSLGHTNTNAENCLQAFDAGARSATHLYNAMSPLTSREPGLVGTAMYREQAYCGLIVDHQHVHPISATLAIRLKGDKKLMLITDAMAPAASDIDHFVYQDVKVIRDGPTLKLDDGTLAGSVLTMEEAVRNTHFDLGISLQSTLRMATSTPAEYLGLSSFIGNLKPGCQATFLSLTPELQIAGIWRDGKQHK